MAGEEVKQIPNITTRVTKLSNTQILQHWRSQPAACEPHADGEGSMAVEARRGDTDLEDKERNQRPTARWAPRASLDGNSLYKSLVLPVCRMMVRGRPVQLRNSVGKETDWRALQWVKGRKAQE